MAKAKAVTAKERIPQYDLIRAVAMFMVVFVHSSFQFGFDPEFGSASFGAAGLITMLALMCNPLFFMISGKFNLAGVSKLEWGGYKTFYLKKILNLLLPVVVYAVIFWILQNIAIQFFGAWDNGSSFFDVKAFFRMTYDLLISSWWFVPTIFALMLVTPFLAKLLSALKGKETIAFLSIIFGCVAIVWLETTLGYTDIFSKFFTPIFIGSSGVFMLGHVIDVAKLDKAKRIKIYVASMSLLILSAVLMIFVPRIGFSEPSIDRGIMMIFYPVICSAVFLLIKNIKIKGEKVAKTIEFIGQRAFGIYLIHFVLFFSYLQLLPEWLRTADSFGPYFVKRLAITIIAYIISLALASAIDLLIVNPMSKRLRKKIVQ